MGRQPHLLSALETKFARSRYIVLALILMHRGAADVQIAAVVVFSYLWLSSFTPMRVQRHTFEVARFDLPASLVPSDIAPILRLGI